MVGPNSVTGVHIYMEVWPQGHTQMEDNMRHKEDSHVKTEAENEEKYL